MRRRAQRRKVELAAPPWLSANADMVNVSIY